MCYILFLKNDIGICMIYFVLFFIIGEGCVFLKKIIFFVYVEDYELYKDVLILFVNFLEIYCCCNVIFVLW